MYYGGMPTDCGEGIGKYAALRVIYIEVLHSRAAGPVAGSRMEECHCHHRGMLRIAGSRDTRLMEECAGGGTV